MTAGNPDVSRQAAVDAALVLLERMGLSPADLAGVPHARRPVPTFAEYVPVVSAAVSEGTRRAYGSYWNRVIEQWGGRRLDEPAPSEIRQLMAYVKTHVVTRRNARGGRSAQEHLVAALRCLYQRAVEDGLIGEADNPARKVAKPRRLPIAAVPEVPAVPDDVLYGFGRMDEWGRVADRAMIAALGWQPGDRLTLTAMAGVVTARRDPGGMVTMPAKPYLVIPAALRRRCVLRPGDRVLLAAFPARDALAAYSFAVVDQALRAHAPAADEGRRP